MSQRRIEPGPGLGPVRGLGGKQTRRGLRGWNSPGVAGALPLALALLAAPAAGWGAPELTNAPIRAGQWFRYTNDVIQDVPWSIHIVRIERGRRDLEFSTTLGKGDQLGMGTVSEQLKTLPPECGEPLAAINGDFYGNSGQYPGRPRDVQIRQGEVVSSPAGHTCFWVDAQGEPHMTNVYSAFRIIWADGKTTPAGLNEDRKDETAVLYTHVVGPSTRTSGGVELILEPATNGCWPPLRIGQTHAARVRAVRNSGDTPLDRETVVLSLGLDLATRLPVPRPGATLRIVTDTVPDLSGAQVAIGGGPALVCDGKAQQWKGFLKLRHPRSALGWNKEALFLVEVDGRQGDLSLGMTFPEFANYLVKLGCEQALNLDGGGSATLWVLGSVRNSPSEGEERPAANALVLVRKRSAPASVPR
jgi:hypothetical protein